MTTTDAKIDFLGEMIGLDDLINRVEAMARIEFSNQQHLSSVTNDTGGLRFIFTVDGKPNQFSYLTSEFFVAAISEHVAQEILRVAKKYERYDRPDFIRKKSLWDRYMEELNAPLEGVTHLGYRG